MVSQWKDDGKEGREAAWVFVEETGISDSLSAEDFLVERGEMLRTVFPTSELMPGILSDALLGRSSAKS